MFYFITGLCKPGFYYLGNCIFQASSRRDFHDWQIKEFQKEEGAVFSGIIYHKLLLGSG